MRQRIENYLAVTVDGVDLGGRRIIKKGEKESSVVLAYVKAIAY